MAMPIMTFDQRVLSPSFGYVFHHRGLQPYESIVGMLWKFARMNRLPGHAVVMHLGRDDVDPYAGIEFSEVDVPLVAKLLGVAQRRVREAIGHRREQACPLLRTCARCMAVGYHARVHQMPRHAQCPIHREPLQVLCSRCQQPSAYRLNALLIDARFRCTQCGAYRTRHGTPPLWRYALPAKDRTAITRAAL